MPDSITRLRQIIADEGDTETQGLLEEATKEIWDFVVQLIEHRRAEIATSDFAESVRFRNSSYRELRHLLGVDSDPSYL